jgi:glycopeptide antibiotics resistance protein
MGQLILDDIYLAAESYLPLAIFSGILGLTLFILIDIGYILITKRSINRIKPGKVIVIFIFYLYLFMIISITLLSREPGSRIRVSLMPFSTFTHNIYGNAFVVENILLFTPLGFILPLLSKSFQSIRTCVAAGGAFSILIEIVQLITQRGYFQTDDIIMNVIGTLLGFGILKLTIKLVMDSS